MLWVPSSIEFVKAQTEYSTKQIVLDKTVQFHLLDKVEGKKLAGLLVKLFLGLTSSSDKQVFCSLAWVFAPVSQPEFKSFFSE